MDDSRRCVAMSKRSGERCRRAAIVGGTVCTIHGGAAPQVRAAAQQRSQTDAARHAVARFALLEADEAPHVDPRDALARELVRCHLAVEFCGQRVNALDDQDIQSSVWVTMWNEQRDRLRQVAAEAARAGVEARQMALAEQTAQMMAGVLRAVFADPELRLSESRQRSALVVAARHLRALPAG